MSRLFAAALLVLIVGSTTITPVFADDQSPAEKANSAAPDDPKALPDGEASEQGQNSSDDEIMKKFTRHRPGGCPEGPPCNFED